jgi:hypothetical protein
MWTTVPGEHLVCRAICRVAEWNIQTLIERPDLDLNGRWHDALS